MNQESIEIILKENGYERKFLMTREEWDKDGFNKILYMALFGHEKMSEKYPETYRLWFN